MKPGGTALATPAYAPHLLIVLSLAAIGGILVLGPIGALVLVAGLGLFFLGLLRPVTLVAAYAAIVFSNAADVATDVWDLPPIGATVMPLLLLILLLRVAAGQERTDGVLVVLPPVALFLIARAWSSNGAPFPGIAHAAVIDLGKDLLILVVFAGLLTSLSRIKITVAASAAAIGLIAALAVFQYATHGFHHTFGGFANAVTRQIVVGQSDGWRLTGPLTDANFFGQLLVLGLPLVAVFLFIGPGRLVRALALAGVLAVITAAVFTFSRGALFGMAAVTVLAIVWLGGRRLRLPLAVGGVTLAVGAATVLPAEYVERVSQTWQALWSLLTGGQFVIDPALAERLSVIRAALYMFTEHPLTGVGIGQFKSLYPEVALHHGLDPGAPGEAHNFYLEMLAEGGVVGLGLFVLLVGTALVLALRARRVLRTQGRHEAAAIVAAVVLSTAGFLMTSIFLHGAYQRFLWVDVALLFSAWSAVRFSTRLSTAADPSSLGSRSVSMTNDRDLVVSVSGLVARSWPVVLIFALAGAGYGLWQVNRTPRSFEAQTTLLYRFGREYFPVAPGEARRDWGANVMMTLDNALFTEMRLLTAHDLFDQTATAVWGPEKAPDAGAKADPKGGRMTATQLADDFRVTRVQGATMLTVSARDADPAVADKLVSTQIAAYLKRRQSLFDQNATAFFTAQIGAARNQLADLARQRETLLRTADPTPTVGSTLQKISSGGDTLAAPKSTDSDAAAMARTLALRPVETRIAEVSDNLSMLVKERDASLVAAAYRKEVSPVVEVAALRPAEGNPVGTSPVMRVAMSAAAAAVLGALLVLFVTLVERLLPARGAARRGEGL